MKKLVTVMFTVTIEKDLPEGETLESLNDFRSKFVGDIFVEASKQICWSHDMEITNVQDAK